MTFLITGASQGIGFELTQLALAQDAKVYAAVRSPESANELNALKATNKNLSLLKLDVASVTDIENLKKSLSDTPIDVLIQNAGTYDRKTNERSPVTALQAEIEEVFAVNTFAPYLISKVLIKNLEAATQPKLATISSLMGSIADNSSGGSYAYRMSKSALNMFVKSFSVDHPKVTTITLHPGWVRTRMGGSSAPVEPKESAQGLMKVILGATPKQTGHFIDYRGRELPW